MVIWSVLSPFSCIVKHDLLITQYTTAYSHQVHAIYITVELVVGDFLALHMQLLSYPKKEKKIKSFMTCMILLTEIEKKTDIISRLIVEFQNPSAWIIMYIMNNTALSLVIYSLLHELFFHFFFLMLYIRCGYPCTNVRVHSLLS